MKKALILTALILGACATTSLDDLYMQSLECDRKETPKDCDWIEARIDFIERRYKGGDRCPPFTVEYESKYGRYCVERDAMNNRLGRRL